MGPADAPESGRRGAPVSGSPSRGSGPAPESGGRGAPVSGSPSRGSRPALDRPAIDPTQPASAPSVRSTTSTQASVSQTAGPTIRRTMTPSRSIRKDSGTPVVR